MNKLNIEAMNDLYGERLVVGLCEGRHPIPGVTEYIYPSVIEDVTDVRALELTAFRYLVRHGGMKRDRMWVQLYVTGLSVALVAMINACRLLDVTLVLMHYDRTSGEYYPQPIKPAHVEVDA